MDTMKDIFNEYGERTFRIALQTLMEIGMLNLTDEYVDEYCETFRQKYSETSVMFRCRSKVIKCARRMVRCGPNSILKFVQQNIKLDTYKVECPKCGTNIDTEEQLYYHPWTCPNCGYNGLTMYRLWDKIGSTIEDLK